MLQGEEKTLYIAGDTVCFPGVERTIETFHPDVILLNCCGAMTPIGRLIMDLGDVESVCGAMPWGTVIASHLDSVSHASITREDVRGFIRERNLFQVLVPEDGEEIRF